MNDTSFPKGNSSELFENSSTRKIKFIVFVFLEPPALICNILLVYYLLTDRTLRQNLYYHSITALLVTCLLTNLIEVPRIIDYLNIGLVIPQSNINCLIWQWCDYLLFGIVNILIFCISIERFLLILYSHIYATTRRRLIFHYLPLSIIIIYTIIFYTVVILINSCEKNFDFDEPLCGFPCYTTSISLSLYDTIVNNWIPLFSSFFVDIYLITQVVNRRRITQQQQQQQRLPWRKYRKMLIQLFVISTLYLTLQVPFNTIISIQLFTILPDIVVFIFMNYVYYFFWLLTLLLPFACIGSIPEVVDKIKHLLMYRTRRHVTVTPHIINYHRNTQF